MTPNIQIPEVTKDKPDAGLTLKRGVWHCSYWKDGKRVQVNFNTVTRKNARTMRDTAFKALLAAGATVTTKGRKPATDATRAARIKANPGGTDYLRYQAPWTVAGLPGQRFETEDEARAARDEYYLNSGQHPTVEAP